MRRLRGGIPRAWRNHKTPEGSSYREYCRAKLEGFKRRGLGLPKDAMPTLREAGVVVIELERLHRDAQSPRRTRLERRRLRRETGILRSQLMTLERRLEEIARINGHGHGDLARLIAAAREGPHEGH